MTSGNNYRTVLTTAKAKVAAIGTTLTAITTALATVTVVLDDDKIDFAEIGSIATAVAVAAGTIYGVWRTPNKVTSKLD